jgi:hypothetical protein
VPGRRKSWRPLSTVLQEPSRNRPDLDTLACVNAACQVFRGGGARHRVIRKVYGHDRLRLWRCRTGGAEVAERRGTAVWNTTRPAPKAEEVLNHRAAGWSVRATARLVTVAGRHAQRFHAQHGHGLTPLALEGDGHWSGVKKRRSAARPTTQRALALCGLTRQSRRTAHWWGVWAWASAPKSRPIPSSTTPSAVGVQGRCPRFFPLPMRAMTPPSWPPWGVVTPGPQFGTKGRAPRPVLRGPHGLAYGQGKKQSQGRRVERVDVRALYGNARLKHVLDWRGSPQMTPRVIERHKGTSRRRNQRQVRKTLALSQAHRDHRWRRWLSVGRYTFCRGQGSVKRRQDAQGQHRRPWRLG